jgi:peptide/nickel transport system ATP-binding protein
MNMALVLISHDLGLIAESCQRVIVLYAGRIVEEAPVAALVDEALHPYSRGLIGALPPLVGTRGKLQAIPGVVPDARFMPPGCAFAPRCFERQTICRDGVPALTNWPGDRRVACFARPQAGGSDRD